MLLTTHLYPDINIALFRSTRPCDDVLCASFPYRVRRLPAACGRAVADGRARGQAGHRQRRDRRRAPDLRQRDRPLDRHRHARLGRRSRRPLRAGRFRGHRARRSGRGAPRARRRPRRCRRHLQRRRCRPARARTAARPRPPEARRRRARGHAAAAPLGVARDAAGRRVGRAAPPRRRSAPRTRAQGPKPACAGTCLSLHVGDRGRHARLRGSVARALRERRRAAARPDRRMAGRRARPRARARVAG
ncbi:conserved hypothetical protein [Burkholderia pseudomallei]|nr:conserved hypothetical protein [Burkholderia pseudomallei]